MPSSDNSFDVAPAAVAILFNGTALHDRPRAGDDVKREHKALLFAQVYQSVVGHLHQNRGAIGACWCRRGV